MSDDQAKVRAEARRRFGKRLKALRVARGAGQRQAALRAAEGNALAGFVPAALGHWEAGRRMPHPSQLRALLRFLQVGETDLLELLDLAGQAGPRYYYGDHVRETCDLPPAERVQAWHMWASQQWERRRSARVERPDTRDWALPFTPREDAEATG